CLRALKRMYFNGRIIAFQAGGVGSSPIFRLCISYSLNGKVVVFKITVIGSNPITFILLFIY
ncbi:hypothetical protein ACA081_01115, partial [Candidatus Hodgkinia cicadicola]